MEQVSVFLIDFWKIFLVFALVLLSNSNFSLRKLKLVALEKCNEVCLFI